MAQRTSKAQTKKSKKNSDGGSKFSLPSLFTGLRHETVLGIWAIVLFVLAAFLLLAAAGKAGIVGTHLYEWLSIVFGVGYYLLPFLIILIGVSFMTSLKDHMGLARTFGGALFLLSGLGIIEALSRDSGGYIGKAVAWPLLNFVEFYATLLFLGAAWVIAILMIFDLRPSAEPLVNMAHGVGRALSFKRSKRGAEQEDEPTINEATAEAAPAAEETAEQEAAPTAEQEDEPRVSTYDDGADEQDESSSQSGATGSLGKLMGGSKKKETGEPAFEIGDAAAAYTPPPLSLLDKEKGKPGVGDVKASSNIIKRTLQNFGIEVEMDEVDIGPSVTRYALKPAEGVRLSKIVSLQNNLELALASSPVRIEAPIPGKPLVGIEVPNKTRAKVGLSSMLAEDQFQNSEKPLLLSLGKDISGESHFADLAKMPHLLVAGATGSGKSVAIHAMVTSLLMRNSPHQLRFIMVDPKRVELTLYKHIPHQLTPVITNAKQAIQALKWAAKEMDRRYDILEAEQVRDIDSYHKNVLQPARQKQQQGNESDSEEDGSEMPETMPYIVIFIDELADIMQMYPRELEAAIVRLAQMSRAVGIHLVLSTQRPSVNVITGLIKANVPARVALQVSSQVDSRTILDAGGAERLLGAGDMLYVSGEMSKPLRLQSAFIAEHETKRITQYLRKEFEDAVLPEVDFSSENVDSNVVPNEGGGDTEEEDDLYDDAKQIVVESGKASTSYIQRKLRVGYARAARLMDMLEERGVVGPAEGSKPREVLVSADDADEGFGREQDAQDKEPDSDTGETAQAIDDDEEEEDEPPKAV